MKKKINNTGKRVLRFFVMKIAIFYELYLILSVACPNSDPQGSVSVLGLVFSTEDKSAFGLSLITRNDDAHSINDT
jgi:hypothetical protein